MSSRLTEDLETLREDAEPFGLRVSWMCWFKTKIQVFWDMLEAAVDSLSVAGENVDVVKTFIYLGSVCNDPPHASRLPSVDLPSRLTMVSMKVLGHECVAKRHLSRRKKVRASRSLVIGHAGLALLM